MKQFWNIYKFELGAYLRNKIFIGVTAVMVVLILGVLSFPRIQEMIGNDDGNVEDWSDEAQDDKSLFYVLDETVALEDSAMTEAIFTETFYDKQIVMTDKDMDELEDIVANGTGESALVIHSATEYTYIIKDVEMYDSSEYMIQEVLTQKYQLESMVNLGLTAQEASDVMNVVITGDVLTLGKNQMDNFFYTYILIFGLYMAILLYGQFVATSVATEKSSRAMELLITSAKTDNLMFGKVLGAGTAGLIQIVAILGVAFLGYSFNQAYWEDNYLVQSVFDMPLEMVVYTVVFFILGFAIYSFLYGAVGSLASKVEDINTSVMPITFLFIIAFFIVVTAMTSGNVDSTIMLVASYFPFTSPMAMFTRIAMGNVAFVEIMISIIILIISTIGIGILSAKIYRVGVLMYGNPPKIGTVIKNIMRKTS